jgi:hypothetical protein
VKALIALEDGTCWESRAFAGDGEVWGVVSGKGFKEELGRG